MQPAEGIAKFLRHLWSTDGCINLSEGKSHYANIYYASSSYLLAKHVQSLLLRLHINGTLTKHAQPNKGREQYHVTVSGKADIELFIAKIGALRSKKIVHQEAILDYLSQRPANTNRDIVPREVWSLYAVPAMLAANITTRKMQADLGNAYCGTSLYK